MKNLKKAAALCAALALAGTAAHAQYTQSQDDLILAFTSATDTSDYTVDLGSLSSITTPTTIGSPSLTTFNADFSSLSGVSVAALGAKTTASGTGKNVILDAVRTGGTASPLGAGTEVMPSGQTANSVGAAVTDIHSLNGANSTEVKTLIGTGPGDTQVTGSVQQELQTTSVGGLTSFSSGSVTLDLWEILANSPSTWTFLGDLTVTDNGTSLSALYTPAGYGVSAAVPEPATYGIIGAMGLLVLALRRQFRGVSA